MTRRSRTAAVLAALALALGALTACGGDEDPTKVTLTGTVVDPPFTIAADALRTTDGKDYSLAKDTDAELTLVFFGYTHCPDICPAVLSSLASGLAKLTKAQQEQVDLLFITTDPKRDTPAVLDDYIHRFNPRFEALTGDLPTIAKVGKSIGIFVDTGEQLASGGYDPNSHGTYVIAVNSDHQAPLFWGGETSPSQFADDIRFLLTEKPERLTRSSEQLA